ncbi:hypothetical protein ACFXJ8_20570 [Nonomuraea sp. NPDC059194]|uniref:hypothetical protein n=1 Tax=Nonomuraea sp. NPDC059194 TaxID=3346764 RepID=UPI003678B8DB
MTHDIVTEWVDVGGMPDLTAGIAANDCDVLFPLEEDDHLDAGSGRSSRSALGGGGRGHPDPGCA